MISFVVSALMALVCVLGGSSGCTNSGGNVVSENKPPENQKVVVPTPKDKTWEEKTFAYDLPLPWKIDPEEYSATITSDVSPGEKVNPGAFPLAKISINLWGKGDQTDAKKRAMAAVAEYVGPIPAKLYEKKIQEIQTYVVLKDYGDEMEGVSISSNVFFSKDNLVVELMTYDDPAIEPYKTAVESVLRSARLE